MMKYNISDVMSLREEKKKLQKRETAVSRPRLTDHAVIERIHSVTFEYIQQNTKRFMTEYEKRGAFTLIVVMLYAPKVLLGERLPKGLRRTVGQLCGASITSISKSFSQAVFFYGHYRAYRDEMNRLYSAVSDWLDSSPSS